VEALASESHPRSHFPHPGTAYDRTVLIIATLAFLALWLWQSLASDGFLEADACTHYLIARFAFKEPYRFVDIWGRPWKTLLYALPAAYFGRPGVRAMSLALALACAALARLFARDMGLRSPTIAYVLTLGMPLVFLHSFSELTELPFAFLLASVFYLLLRDKSCWAALWAGMLPLARPEGFGFVLLAGLFLLYRRRLKALLFLPLGLLLWTYLGWEAYGRDGNPLTWIPRHWPYAGQSVYASGSLFQFIALLPALVGPVVLPGFLLGAISLTRQNASRHSTYQARVGLAVLATPTIVLIAHSLLYYFGKMASNGELRYMLVAAPFWAAITAFGWERMWQILTGQPRTTGILPVREPAKETGYTRNPHRQDAAMSESPASPRATVCVTGVSPVSGSKSPSSHDDVPASHHDARATTHHLPTRLALLSSLAAVLIPLVMQTWMYGVLPIRMDNAWNTTRFIALWAAQYGQSHDRPAIMSAHPGVFYFLDRSQNDFYLARDFTTSNIAKPPPGTILLYDPVYARFNATRERRVEGLDEIRRSGWIEMPYMTIGGWHVFLSPEPLRLPRR
jgi:hypothetical protein